MRISLPGLCRGSADLGKSGGGEQAISIFLHQVSRDDGSTACGVLGILAQNEEIF
jgi:hypothetical protein